MKWLTLILTLMIVSNIFTAPNLKKKSNPQKSSKRIKRKVRKLTPFVEAGPKKTPPKKKTRKLTPFVEAGTAKNKKKDKKDKDYLKYQEILDYGTSHKRLWIIQQIIKNKNKLYYPLLKRILKDETNENVYLSAIDASKRLELKEFASLIAPHIHSESVAMKTSVIEALGEFRYSQSEGEILNILKNDTNKWLKSACIKALGNMKSVNALPELMKVFGESETNSEMKLSLIQAVGKIKSSTSIPFLDKHLTKLSNASLVRAYSAGALGKIGGLKAFSILKEYVDDKDVRVVIAVIQAFGETRSDEGYQILYQSLKHDNPKIRYAALVGLEKLKVQKAFKILKYMVYNDDNYKVRQKAVDVMSQIRSVEVTKLWAKELKSNMSGLKIQMIHSIHHLNKRKGFRLLTKTFVREKDNNIRKIILDKLFEIDRDKAVQMINRKVMYKNDEEYLGLKLHSLALIRKHFHETGLTVLKKYLSHQNIHVRRHAYFYLIGNDRPDSRQLVFQMLPKEKDKSVMLYVIRIFKDRKLKSSIPLLKKQIKRSFHPQVRKEAKEIVDYLESQV
ncbi:MAG: hypothetical protein IEMM0008_0694 [bacterium]|nr:MAG: hypothetical protein IEMM0008_0694 [bacterium]